MIVPLIFCNVFISDFSINLMQSLQKLLVTSVLVLGSLHIVRDYVRGNNGHTIQLDSPSILYI